MVKWRRPARLALLGGAIAAACVLSEQHTRLFQHNVSDDAVTSMQYAKNLVLGRGLVFNAGERVDGYTNFLWVLFMAPVYAFTRLTSLDFVGTVVQLTVGIQALVLALLYVVAAGRFQARFTAFVAVALCVIDTSFTSWAVLGLEVHFLAFWLLLALALWRSQLPFRALFAGLALSAAVLTRPDALLFGAAVVGSELLEVALAYLRGDRRGALALARELALMSAAWLLPYAVYFAWHYSYYGEPFPNTYYTKLGGPIDAVSRGLDYLSQFLDMRAWVPALGVLAAFGARDKTLRAVVLYLTVHTAYVVYVGGDFMPGNRFFVPQLPLYYLLVSAALDLGWRVVQKPWLRRPLAQLGASPAFFAGFGVASVLGALALLADREERLGPVESVRTSWGEDHGRQRRLMTWLSKRKPKNATFATGLIGHVGFYGDIYVIDTCGIIDKEVAHRHVENFGHGLAGHEKWASPEATLARKPTYIGIRVLPGDLWQRGYFLDLDLPPDTVDGLWTRDDLPERGHYLEGTRIDFDQGAPAGWTTTGTAFESWPSEGHAPGQGEIFGANGRFVNSFHPQLGTAATGTLRSPPFLLEGDLLVFRIAGGTEPEKLRASLLIDGERVRNATAHDNDTMGRRAWDIRPYHGKRATFEVVDDVTGGWGYVAIDEIVQWSEGK